MDTGAEHDGTSNEPKPAECLYASLVTEEGNEMNSRNGGVGIVGVIIIVLVILWLLKVI